MQVLQSLGLFIGVGIRDWFIRGWWYLVSFSPRRTHSSSSPLSHHGGHGRRGGLFLLILSSLIRRYFICCSTWWDWTNGPCRPAMSTFSAFLYHPALLLCVYWCKTIGVVRVVGWVGSYRSLRFLPCRVVLSCHSCFNVLRVFVCSVCKPLNSACAVLRIFCCVCKLLNYLFWLMWLYLCCLLVSSISIVGWFDGWVYDMKAMVCISCFVYGIDYPCSLWSCRWCRLPFCRWCRLPLGELWWF